ncbi:hypothetical protein [Pseudomonas zhanjiangensis]|uniref:Uncharacterized protein n=1 Tax=Pseudomonas zhanjiangensis TaxID=3239015 RepID=A0ABV3YYK3_9PSED
MKGFFCEFKVAAAQAPAIFFAPLLGAIRGVKSQWAFQRGQATALPTVKK